MKRVGIVFGGESPEHGVSVVSAETIVSSLDRALYEAVLFPIDKKGMLFRGDGAFEFLKTGDSADVLPVSFDSLREMDVVFPILHGPFGEDGTIQGLLEMMKIPYVGCGVEASALNMHKGLFRDVFAAKGFPQPRYCYFRQKDTLSMQDEVRSSFPLPLFVKPCHGGSSIGISRVETMDKLAEALNIAFRFDPVVIVEEGICVTEELEVAVLGQIGDLTVAGPGKLIAGDKFYSYDDKYVKNRTRFQIPAEDLPIKLVEKVRRFAIDAFEISNCFGLARIDFLYDRNSERLVLNEINTMPGFTGISMYPKLMMTTGMSFSELVSRLLELAFQRGQ